MTRMEPRNSNTPNASDTPDASDTLKASGAAAASGKAKWLRGRRLALLASVAGLGAFVMLAGPGFYRPAGFDFATATARAAEPAPAQANLPHPPSFADIVAKVKPAVVSVRVTIKNTADDTSLREDGSDQVVPFAPGSPMQKFFQQFGQQFGHQFGFGLPQGHETIIGEGSGFFISPDGYLVTNNHVVKDATSVQVTTADGTVYKAKVVGTDPKTDLALIKVDGKNDFPYVKFATHEPRVGDWVIAVGNPFGLGGTVTAGIVSAESRNIGAGPYDDYIQIDAPINKGNSGGPAFNMNGHVIGINTAIYSPSGGSVGIGFDIPAQTAERVVAELKAHGYVTRGWLGVEVQPVTAGIADSLGLKKPEGAIVDSVQAASPAAKAGLKSGDVIADVNGVPVKNARALARAIAKLAPDSSVKIDIERHGKSETIAATLAKMPNQQVATASASGSGGGSASATPALPHLGLTVAPAKDVAGAGDDGVVVTAVDPNGPAAQAGFQTGNVILDVGGKAVANAGDVVKELKEAKAQGKHDVLMRVKTGDTTEFVALPLGKA